MAARSKKRFVITGATGFLGRRLVESLLAEDAEVVALVRNAEANVDLLALGVEVQEWSIEDQTNMSELIDGASTLFHAAAHIPTDYRDSRAAPLCYRVNAQGTYDLYSAARDVGVPQIVHFSTGNMYAPAQGLVDEKAPLYPSVAAPFYLASKLVGEIYSDYLRRSKGLRIAILRVASSYGPGMKLHGMVPEFATRVLASQPLLVSDGGNYGVDLVYVDDVVGAAQNAAELSADGIFNVGSGRRTSVLEVAKTLLRLAGAEPNLLQLERPKPSEASPGFPGLDISKARSQLNFTPTPLELGLRHYLESRR